MVTACCSIERRLFLAMSVCTGGRRHRAASLRKGRSPRPTIENDSTRRSLTTVIGGYRQGGLRPLRQ